MKPRSRGEEDDLLIESSARQLKAKPQIKLHNISARFAGDLMARTILPLSRLVFLLYDLDSDQAQI